MVNWSSVLRDKDSERVPLVRCDRVDQDITIDVYGVRLWKNGVLILEKNPEQG